MKTYIGTKFIRAIQMTRAQYNEFRDWPLPANENGDDEGYLVEYLDGGRRNTDEYEGYVSWSPKDVFEKSYRQTEGMTFGLAIEAMRSGKSVQRMSWKETNKSIKFNPIELDSFKNVSWMGIVNDEGYYVPYVPTQTDMSAKDWSIVE
jgi:Protein of unknown function (DUF2829)